MKTPHFWLFCHLFLHFITLRHTFYDLSGPWCHQHPSSSGVWSSCWRRRRHCDLSWRIRQYDPSSSGPLYVPGCFLSTGHHRYSPTGPQTYKATQTGPSRTGSGCVPRNIGDLLGWAGSCSWSLSRTVASSPRAPAVLQEQFIVRQPEAKEQDKKPLEPHLRFLGPGEFWAREDSPLPHPVHASVLQPHVHVCPVHYLRAHWPWSRS